MMMLKTTALTALVLLSGAACATASSGGEMSEKVAARLAEFEATGDAESCLNTSRIRSIDALDDWRFLVRTTGNNYYLNEISHRCSGAGRPGNRLQYRISGSQLCRNDIIRVVDNSSGFTVGSCGLSSFQELEKTPPADEQ